MTTRTPPTDVWIGKEDGKWPVHIFIDTSSALYWLDQPSERRRHLWKAKVTYGDELRVVKTEPRLEPIDEP